MNWCGLIDGPSAEACNALRLRVSLVVFPRLRVFDRRFIGLAYRFFEASDGFAERFAQFGELTWTENHQGNYENNDQFWHTKASEHASPPGRREYNATLRGKGCQSSDGRGNLAGYLRNSGCHNGFAIMNARPNGRPQHGGNSIGVGTDKFHDSCCCRIRNLKVDYLETITGGCANLVGFDRSGVQGIASLTPSYVDFSFGLRTTIAMAAVNNAGVFTFQALGEYAQSVRRRFMKHFNESLLCPIKTL